DNTKRCRALVVKKERNGHGLVRVKLNALGCPIELRIHYHPHGPDLLARRHQKRANDDTGRAQHKLPVAEHERDAEYSIGDCKREVRRGDRTPGWRGRATHPGPDRNNRDDEFLKRWPSVMKSQVTTGPKYAGAYGKDEFQVRRITERGSRYAHATRWGRPATTDPATTMEFDGVPARR